MSFNIKRHLYSSVMSWCQGNDSCSTDAAANNGRWLQHGTLSLWLRSVYKCAIWQGRQVFQGLRAFNAQNTALLKSAHAQGSPQGIKHVARPHYHVEPDVHEHMQISTSWKLPAKLLDYFLRSDKSNINQYIPIHVYNKNKIYDMSLVHVCLSEYNSVCHIYFF